MDAIEELEGVPSKVKPDEIKLAKQVIGNFEGQLDLAEYKDAYQEELQRIIDAKIAGEEVVAPIEQAPPKVVNLMDALRQSLDRVSTRRRSRRRPTSRSRPKRSSRPRLPARRSAPAASGSASLELVENLAADELRGASRAASNDQGGTPADEEPPSTRLRGGLECQSRVAQTQLFQNSPGNSFEILLGHPQRL